ncbi:MAG: hypothetical protein KGL44_03660 [Sphingomonadales bacterium]|nr:hypothetical protein [Sphingomonadales bacterium]
MIRVPEVTARIEAQVPALAGRLGTATQFSVLVQRGQMPQQSPAGFVLPGALSGGVADAMTGLFRQAFDETVAVVLAVRSASDPTGAKAADELTPLIRAVVLAVCGWAPDDALGVFVLNSGDFVGFENGTFIYQIDFKLDDQLRIVP